MWDRSGSVSAFGNSSQLGRTFSRMSIPMQVVTAPLSWNAAVTKPSSKRRGKKNFCDSFGIDKSTKVARTSQLVDWQFWSNILAGSVRGEGVNGGPWLSPRLISFLPLGLLLPFFGSDACGRSIDQPYGMPPYGSAYKCKQRLFPENRGSQPHHGWAFYICGIGTRKWAHTPYRFRLLY